MNIEINPESPEFLAEYSRIPIAFRVETIFVVGTDNRLVEQRVNEPSTKNYDEHEPPRNWPERFDLFSARAKGQLLGAAAIDGCTLHDIRVHPDHRGQGIGSALFRKVTESMSAKGCARLSVETQNINVPASRFYETQGCTLETINRSAYTTLPDEIQLIWIKKL